MGPHVTGPVLDRPARRSRRGRPPRWAVVLAVMLLGAAGVLGGVELARSHGSPSATARGGGPADAAAPARAFLAGYVDADGRVVRRDQGGDTVSEGQAYALLLTFDLGDRTRFRTIWAWTRDHLQRPDGSLAYHWRDGSVADPTSAPDADLDAADALLSAGRAWAAPDLSAAGRRIAAADLASSTSAAGEARVLTAGPWATGRGGTSATLNPSYLAPGAASRLAALTGESDWNAVATGTRTVDTTLLASAALPPDWATLPAGSPATAVVAAGAPDGSAGPRYGLDAPRLFVRLATSCAATDRALAARTGTAAAADGAVGVRSLDGAGQVSWHHPLTAVAAAAVAYARGDPAGVRTRLATAARWQAAAPTYYGAAWLALGTIELSAAPPGACPGTR